MAQSYEQAAAFTAAIGGEIFDFRAIHDTDKGVPAIPFRGTLVDCWGSIVHYNNLGYGIFAVIAMMDGRGRELENVHYLRGHYVDLDNLSAQQNYDLATAAWPAPSFAVHSSVGPLKGGNGAIGNKYHVYWVVSPYQGNDRFSDVQRKLRQVFDGDHTIIDAPRVMRLPGTLHLKDPSQPHLVRCWALAGFGQPTTVEQLEAALAGVNVIDGGSGMRHELGDPDKAAPSLDWLRYALTLADPNTLDRAEWIAMTAAIKQAGWTLTDPDTLYQLWSQWCGRYEQNDIAENLKQWNSLRNTELGWQSLMSRIPSLRAAVTFGGQQRQAASASPVAASATFNAAPPMPAPPALDCSGEYLTHIEQAEWFKGCAFVTMLGQIVTPDGRFLSANQFNGAYGGKKFIIDTTGKMTNEAWQAALRSTLWTIPKVDHIRFSPADAHGAILIDALGRSGVNTYKPIKPRTVAGDATPFLNHIAAMLPVPSDQRILLDYLAHNAKFPGHKIPWAPVIQSAEGAGKGVLKAVMAHVLGQPYVYFPNAKELTNSGSQFNAWMRRKLFILADEIKVDDRADLIEVLKPMISEKIIEIQGKGVDQDLEDNFSNWLFFTNYKNAIPVNKNGRRYAIFYSTLQTADDLIARGMNEHYFDGLYGWLAGDGAAIVADMLLNWPIERGAIPMRAPATSSTGEALDISRSPIERMVAEAIEDGLPGFKGGWVSVTAAINRVKATGAIRGGTASPQLVTGVLEGMGYRAMGRSVRPYFQEDRESRSQLYFKGQGGDIADYGRAQGWE